MRISRASFLRGSFAGSRPVVRPPWSKPESEFIEACSRCNDCVRACPENIIIQGRSGFPEVDFSRGTCIFCGVCASVCPDGAIDRVDRSKGRPRKAWALTPAIGNACLAMCGVECRVCTEACEPRAIIMKLRVGGPAQPFVEPGACTGCGACVAPCPAGAIAIQPLQEH